MQELREQEKRHDEERERLMEQKQVSRQQLSFFPFLSILECGRDIDGSVVNKYRCYFGKSVAQDLCQKNNILFKS